MNTINKKMLDEVIETIRELLSVEGWDNELCFKAIRLANTACNDKCGAYDIVFGSQLLKRNVTNEQIYKIFEILGFEVK